MVIGNRIYFNDVEVAKIEYNVDGLARPEGPFDEIRTTFRVNDPQLTILYKKGRVGTKVIVPRHNIRCISVTQRLSKGGQN
jgi:hypothetical protein